MKLTNARHSLSIAESRAKDSHSRVRRQFNTLIKKLEAARRRLADWEAALPGIMNEAEREFHPLAQAYSVHQREMLVLLDQMHQHRSLGKRERAKLSDFICTLALELMAGGDDVEFKDIYNRHSGGDFDEETEQDDAISLSMIADILGLQMDDDDLRSPEDMLEAMAAREGQGFSEEQPAGRAKAGARRKSASALAQERRQAAAEDELKQSVRDIFRKLASGLHPDREPDADQRERKTALMQRVNVAYKAQDLLSLLDLQWEAQQIDQADLNSLSEERIKAYNNILERQLRETRSELDGIEQNAVMDSGGRLRRRPTPQLLLRCLRVDIAEMRAKVNTITIELNEFKDIKKLKAWLKTYSPAVRHDYDDVYWF
ncbi:J domain-containing protein [Massilia terrae]|uniref:J domain-containing protein n=1 Tax=Massilia terrae TaxID=1811224 RepID=A0ABT2D6R1_9BURK|nr:J domain-containing protein [Massilia terrae]MCS0661055.1 J domain-containing protein [Massilia terrae]